MERKILYLISSIVIIPISSLFAQTWSPPILVSQNNTAVITGYGLTADHTGMPWSGWCAFDMYVSHYVDTMWFVLDTIHPILGFLYCDLTTDANGNIWVVGDDGDAFISACFYNGSSWSNLMQVPSQGTCCHFPFATSDTMGNLWICWTGGGPGEGHHVWGNTYSEDQWGSPFLISYPGSTEEFAYSITTDKQGRVWVGYYRFGYDCPEPEICSRYNNGSGWSDTMIIAEYSDAAAGPALTVDTAGRVWAGWTHADSGGTSYKVSASYFDGNVWYEPMLVSGGVALGDWSVAITSDNHGIVWLTWMSADCDIYYSYWNGIAWSSPASIDTDPADDYWPRMTFDGERIWVTWIRENGSNVYASYTYGLDVEEKPTADRISIQALSQNYPNPFKRQTVIRFELPKASNANLSIYDISGRLVKQFNQLTNDQSPIIWDGKDDFGNILPAGVYFYKIKFGDFSDAKRMVLLH